MKINSNGLLWKFLTDNDSNLDREFSCGRGNICILDSSFIKTTFSIAAATAVITFFAQAMIFAPIGFFLFGLNSFDDIFASASFVFGLMAWLLIGTVLIAAIFKHVNLKRTASTSSTYTSLYTLTVNYLKAKTGKYCIPVELSK